jgi:hypothetical protein
MAKQPARSAKEVIDQAIADNKWNEYLLYAFAVVFVLAGMTALIWGMVKGEGTISLAGGIASVLFIPAMTQARQIRRENIAIRLLEQPLSMAGTSKEAADALREFFVNTFIARRSNP